ncbi:MAG TPA: class II fructose-bisphosphate aldolase [Bacillales bacterium]|nr:class II fructose-bisphosphate aldolase [Bacillales bacterium]
MTAESTLKNVLTLKEILIQAESKGYGVGSFAPRYTNMIRPILRAGEATNSPLIVQISQKEMDRYGITPFEFSDEFYRVVRDENLSVPVVLHLDHTKELSGIKDAIAAGFTSVMMDASEKPLEENIALSKEAAQYAHEHGVSIEAELGKIGTTDFVETDRDEELYTDPEEAKRFVRETGVDALAVSVGTAHGVYNVRKPKVDLERLKAIRALTDVLLVLHGGSGVPAEMVKQAIQLPNGGVSKVNVATDLEVAVLSAIGREERMTNAECRELSEDLLKVARTAVQKTVTEKIIHFLGSDGHARDFG